MALRTEADLVRSLEDGTYTVAELYDMARDAGLPDRPGGSDIAQDGKAVWKRRVRSALQSAKRSGTASRVADGTWVLHGTRRSPAGAILIVFGDLTARIELVAGDAATVLRSAAEPVALVVADPPWGLERHGAAATSAYGRDRSLVVGGYRDVPAEAWAEFCARWMAAAHQVVAEHGYLAVITGPQQAAVAQVTAENVGFSYVNSIVVTRTMPVRTLRRLAHSHHRVTLLTKGDLADKARYFHVPDDLPKARSGADYPRDVWDDIGDYRRRGLLRYENSQHPRTYMRLMTMCSQLGDLCADPFLGSGTAVVAALATGRRLLGGDVNVQSLRFTVARALAEDLPTAVAS